MPDGLEKYLAQFRDLRSEVAYLTARLHRAREGLIEQAVQSRATINESRELMMRADEIMGGKAPDRA